MCGNRVQSRLLCRACSHRRNAKGARICCADDRRRQRKRRCFAAMRPLPRAPLAGRRTQSERLGRARPRRWRQARGSPATEINSSANLGTISTRPSKIRALPYNGILPVLRRASAGTTGTLASRIRCDFDSIPTQLHTAPASRALLARIIEVQHTLSALTHTVMVQVREQHRRTVRDWSK